MIAAGRLNKRVAFERPQRTDDGGGGASVTWVREFTVWGALTPERGRERLQAGRLASEVAGVLKVRSSSQTRDVDETYRVIVDNVPYQVRAIANPDQRNAVLEMVVERGVAT